MIETGDNIKDLLVRCSVRKSYVPMEPTPGNRMDAKIYYCIDEDLFSLIWDEGSKKHVPGIRRIFSRNMHSQLNEIFGWIKYIDKKDDENEDW